MNIWIITGETGRPIMAYRDKEKARSHYDTFAADLLAASPDNRVRYSVGDRSWTTEYQKGFQRTIARLDFVEYDCTK